MDASVASLFDPPGTSVLLADANWMQGTLLGTLATVIAIIAVATIGIGMFAGRVDLRRGLTIVIGCFILFGAPAIAVGLLALADRAPVVEVQAPQSQTPLAIAPSALPQPPPNQAFDPYAGAAVPR
jgi:type IV secretory pathway VirB2 component (pilin)